MPPVQIVTQQATGTTYSQKSVEVRLESHDALLKYILIGVVGSIIIFGVDMYRQNELHERMTQLESDVANYRAENIKEMGAKELADDNQKNIDMLKQCLGLGGWSTCFK